MSCLCCKHASIVHVFLSGGLSVEIYLEGAGLVDIPDESVGDVALQRRLRRGRDEPACSPGTLLL